MPQESSDADPRTLLAKYNLHAKKSWGQNFLTDERAYRAIVGACAVGPDDVVIEIGAGLGTLTSRLLGTGAQVIAVERERDMCDVLRKELGEHPRFTLREENALNLTLAELDIAVKPVVVGNLPYQIATPLLFHFLGQRALLRHLVVMLQREVADRLLAPAGGEHYGALSAQVQILAQVERICNVSRGGFLPAPKVESTVVRVRPLPETRVPVRELGAYQAVVRAAFGQRRKTLRNALGSGFGAADIELMAATGIDLGRRGETLSVAEFAQLANALPPTDCPP
jgi:16S rRNA (adenine1518-N6/adenine1519-N6)-dimethyltransferase